MATPVEPASAITSGVLWPVITAPLLARNTTTIALVLSIAIQSVTAGTVTVWLGLMGTRLTALRSFHTERAPLVAVT